MHISLVRSFVLFVVVLIAVAFESGCVGVTSAAKAPARTSAVGTVSIAINPPAVSIQVGAFQQFSATVTGTADTTVTWLASGGSVRGRTLHCTIHSGHI